MSFSVKSANKFVEMASHTLRNQTEKDIKDLEASALEASQSSNTSSLDTDSVSQLSQPVVVSRQQNPGSQTGMYMRSSNVSYSDYL